MLASDHKNTVLSEVRKDGRQDVAYTAYGDSVTNGSLGFNGERCEAQTGFYLLGNGNRAYNTCLMRFHSPDSFSPFGEGGLNSYMYCGGNPVDYVDETGNWRILPVWLSKFFSRSFGGAGKTGLKTAKVSKAAKVPNGRVVNGNVKNGFFDNLKNGNINTQPIKVDAKGLATRAPVRGNKFGELLENPPSGFERVQERLKKPVVKKGVFNSDNSVVEEPASMFAGHMESIAKSPAGPSKAKDAVKSLRQGGISQRKEALKSLEGNVGS